MRLLKKVKILGRIFSVEYCDMRGKKDSTSRGYVLHQEQKIVIDTKNNSRETQESTLLHEIIHVLCDTFGISLEEHHVNLLEAGLYQVLKDNKLLKGD